MTKIIYKQRKELGQKYNCNICNDTGQWKDYTDAFGGSRIVICNCRIAIKENYEKLLGFVKRFCRLEDPHSINYLQAGTFRYDVIDARKLLKEIGEIE